MNENSDIRAGGRAMTAATIICCAFAATATVSALRATNGVHGRQAVPPSASVHANVTRSSAETTAKRLKPAVNPVLRTIAKSDSGQVERTFSQESDSEATNVASVDPRVSTDLIQDLPASAIDPQGIYVPVTVHPVTVNFDGSAFAEQVGRLADNVGQAMAAPQLDLATLSAVEDRIHVAMRDDRLSQIDANLERLTTRVESLISESRQADATLNGELQQTLASAQLVTEFRQTLAEHRELLTARHAVVQAQERNRVAQAPLSSTKTNFEEDHDVPLPVQRGASAKPMPVPEPKPAEDIMHVPLPPADDIPDAFLEEDVSVIAEDWDIPLAEAERQTDSAMDEARELSLVDQSAPDESSVGRPVEVPLSDSDSAEFGAGRATYSASTDSALMTSEQTESPDQVSEPSEDVVTPALTPPPVITVRESVRITEPETAKERAAAEATARTIAQPPVLELPVAVAPEPVVFEQTVNFAMPPAADPLEGMHANNASIDQAGISLGDLASQTNSSSVHSESRTATRMTRRMSASVPAPRTIPNRPATTSDIAARDGNERNTSTTGNRAEGIVVPERHLAGNHRPAPLRPVPTGPRRRHVRRRADGAFDALTDAGGMVTDRATSLIGRVWQDAKLPRMHVRARQPSQVMHRFGAAIRGVGRSPLVN